MGVLLRAPSLGFSSRRISMEEEKAAAYYDELTRKGEGAARFKQGLGFTSSQHAGGGDGVPARGSAVPSPSSFLSSFVRASSPSKAAEFEKQKQLENIQNKLKIKSESEERQSRVSERRESSRRRHRSPSREIHRERHSRRRSRSRDRPSYRSSSRDRDRDRDRRREGERRSGRRRGRSRSRSVSDEERRRRRDRKGSQSRSSSPRREQRSERRGGGGDKDGVAKVRKERNHAVDYSRLIEGYDKMVSFHGDVSIANTVI